MLRRCGKARAEDSTGRRNYNLKVRDLRTGKDLTTTITGAEALVRWLSPEQTPGQGPTLVPPAMFIPIAEDTGLIGAIGEVVL